MESWLAELMSLIGGQITGVVVDDDDKRNVWVGLKVRTSAGENLLLWAMMDAEGNGPGWFLVEKDGSDER